VVLAAPVVGRQRPLPVVHDLAGFLAELGASPPPRIFALTATPRQPSA
jgi:hypothetical protein